MDQEKKQEQVQPEEFRPSNDSRKRRTPEASKAVQVVETKPTLGQRWQNLQPTKAHLIWACVATALLTMIVGFSWGGWVSAGNAQKTATTMASDAVAQRLAPICVAQFNLDPDKTQKLVDLNEMTSYQQSRFVQEQGWATIAGDENPDRKVADACTNLLLAMGP